MSDRTLVLDLGGVVLRWEPVTLVRETLGRPLPWTDQELLQAVYGGFAAGGFWQRFDRGELGLGEVAAHMAAGSGLEVVETRRVLDAVPAHIRPLPETVAAVRAARAAGHRVVYLSNMPAPFADLLDDVVGPLFDDGVFSGRVGHAKPDPDIFSDAERRLGLDPGALLFLDDTERNVVAARSLGWAAEQVAGPADCARLLGDAGWLAG